MANPLQIRAFQEAEKMIEEALIRDLERIWTVIKDRPPVEASDMLQNGVIPLINKYGLMAAAVAADWYEELTGETAFLPDTYNEESWMASARWALSPIFSKDAGEAEKRAALKRLTASAVRHTRQYYRNTVDESVRRSSGTVRYARRVTGATSCDFCLMLASRGPVYGTAADAGGPSNRYHDDCDCIPVPVRGKWVMDNSERGEHWEGQDPGYDFERLYSEEYKPFHQTGDDIRDTIARKRAIKMATRMEQRRDTRKASIDGTLQRDKWDKFREYAEKAAADRGIVLDGDKYKLPPRNWEEPPSGWPDNLPSLRAKEWNHILYGEIGTGGHLYGFGWINGRTEFSPNAEPNDVAELLRELLKKVDFSDFERTKEYIVSDDSGNIFSIYLAKSHGKMRVTSFHKKDNP